MPVTILPLRQAYSIGFEDPPVSAVNIAIITLEPGDVFETCRVDFSGLSAAFSGPSAGEVRVVNVMLTWTFSSPSGTPAAPGAAVALPTVTPNYLYAFWTDTTRDDGNHNYVDGEIRTVANRRLSNQRGTLWFVMQNNWPEEAAVGPEEWSANILHRTWYRAPANRTP